MASSSLDAAAIITIQEDGPNVVVVGSGSLNIDDLAYETTIIPFFGWTDTASIQPNTSRVRFSPQSMDLYQTVTSFPPDIGAGIMGHVADSNVGADAWGVDGSRIGVPIGYVSGTPLSGEATFLGQSIASLQLTPGTYLWNWGSGANADSITLQIGPVPEPATGALACVAGLLLVMRRRRGCGR